VSELDKARPKLERGRSELKKPNLRLNGSTELQPLGRKNIKSASTLDITDGVWKLLGQALREKNRDKTGLLDYVGRDRPYVRRPKEKLLKSSESQKKTEHTGCVLMGRHDNVNG